MTRQVQQPCRLPRHAPHRSTTTRSRAEALSPELDGSAKDGIVVQVQRELGVPVKLVGLGEDADDLAPFDAGAFVDALLG